MDSIGDLLKKKATDIDIDAKKSDLSVAQVEFDRLFSGSVHVKQITAEGKIMVRVNNSPMASEVRLNQEFIINNLTSTLNRPITKLIIQQY